MFSFKRRVGNKAEELVLDYLAKQGLNLIDQNYITKFGEIDIIMQDLTSNTLVFVEVRYRKDNKFSSAIETVDTHKQNKIIKSAKLFLQKHSEYQQSVCRFDVVGVESDLKYPEITWIKDAFEA